ncbi:MAG: 4Fe-4S double cluster binding domain-containing protein [Candidatus Latescibacterota bacterium]
MPVTDLDSRVRALALQLGADFCGVADLTAVQDQVQRQGGTLVSGYPRAVSVGVALLHALVDQLPDHRDPLVAAAYRHHGYDVVNLRLDQLAARLASALQAAGHRALPIAASQQADPERLCAVFSHRLAAHQAGMGWIGRSCALVTPQVGPRARWATVLTDAPLQPGTPMDVRCGECRACVEACPAGAISGQAFRADQPREARLDAPACRRYQEEVKAAIGLPVCGMCLYACPHGRQAPSREPA